jgi:hypothetical protein
MKQASQRIIRWVIILIASLAATYWWFNDARFVPFSEALWSRYNQLFAGQRPGLASDLEFLTVLLGSAILAGMATWAIFRPGGKRDSEMR